MRFGAIWLTHRSDLAEQPSRKAAQLAWISWQRALMLPILGIESSVGSVGDSFDNSLAETINGLYKTEVIRSRGPCRSIDAVEYATLQWVDWFNNRRLLEPIDDVPPAEFEQAYYDELERQAVAA